jgi:hypothetical protein
MATYYFLNTDTDEDWANSNNWWDAPSGGNSGYTPSTGDDVVILGTLSQVSSGSASVANATVEGVNLSSITLTVSGTCTIQNSGYFGDGATLYGNMICSTNGYVGINSSGGTIYGDLTFQNNGSTDNITSCTVYGNLYFAANWTGSASYISVSMSVVYYYGYTGTASNLTVNGATYYSNYPTLYWNNAAMDNDWSNLNNWWVDVSCTQKSYEYATSSRAVEMLANIYSPFGTAECSALNVTNGYSVVLGLTVYGTATFNDTSSYGSPSVSVTMTVSDAVMNDSSYVQSPSTVTVNNTMTFNDSSYNQGTINGFGSVVAVYPVNRNTFNSNGTISASGGLSYSGYPSYFYFYGGSDWYALNNWYTNSGHTINAGYIPGSLDDVIIESDINNSSSTMNANSAIITNIITPNYTLNITNGLTINSGGQIGNGFTNVVVSAGYAEFNSTSAIMGGAQLTTTAETDFNNSSSLNGGTVIAGSPGVRFYDTSTFTNGTITGDVTLFSPLPLPFTMGGTYSGSLSYSGYSSRTVYFYSTSSADWSTSSNWWSDSAHTTQTYAPIPAAAIDDVIVESSVTQNMNSLDTTIGILAVKNNADISINITCYSATFEDTSSFGQNNTGAVLDQNSSTVSITFSEMSINYGSVLVTDTGAGTPSVVFEDGASTTNSSVIQGNVDVYYPVSLPLDGTINGIITYYNYPPYFNGPVDGDWNNPNNWFLDIGGTIPANSVPTETYPGVNVILLTNVTNSTGGVPTAYDLSFGYGILNINGLSITVNGLATFEQGCSMGVSATIYGDALFKNTGYNNGGTISGSVTFDLEAAEIMILYGYDGTYSGGNITFEYGKGVNGSSILGIV